MVDIWWHRFGSQVRFPRLVAQSDWAGSWNDGWTARRHSSTCIRLALPVCRRWNPRSSSDCEKLKHFTWPCGRWRMIEVWHFVVSPKIFRFSGRWPSHLLDGPRSSHLKWRNLRKKHGFLKFPVKFSPSFHWSLDSLDVCVCLTGFGRLFYKCDSARRLDCDVGALAKSVGRITTMVWIRMLVMILLVAVSEHIGYFGSQLPTIFLKDAKKDPANNLGPICRPLQNQNIGSSFVQQNLRNQSNIWYPIGWCLEHTMATLHPSGAKDG